MGNLGAVKMVSMVEHLMARVYTEAAGSKHSQGGVGGVACVCGG